MHRKSLALAALALGAAVLATAAVAGPAAAPKLVGTVGPGFSISLTSGGKKVSSLKAGTYTVVVSDKAAIHNFVLEQQSGGGFEKQLTSVPFTGTKTATITLKAGKWKYYCRPHESSMFGEFTVR
jgi:plastocyanin